MSAKLTLDTNALKYFLEQQGPDFTLQIKKAVIATVVKSELKKALTDETASLIREETKVAAKTLKEVMEQIGVDHPYRPTFTHTYREFVRKTIDAEIRSLIDEAISATNVPELLEARLENAIAVVKEGYLRKAIREAKTAILGKLAE